MNRVTKRIGVVVGLVALGAILVLTCQEAAARAFAGRPSTVVSVNLAMVLEKLDQRAMATVSLKAMSDSFMAEKTKRETELAEFQKQLDAMKDEPDGPERRELQERAAALLMDYQAWARFATSRADLEESLVLKDLYRAIKAAVKTMAAAEGYDIVLVDDSQGELMTTDDARVSRAAQVKQQIIARRMLYASPTVDITDHLITRMNNEFKAGPAPATAPQ